MSHLNSVATKNRTKKNIKENQDKIIDTRIIAFTQDLDSAPPVTHEPASGGRGSVPRVSCDAAAATDLSLRRVTAVSYSRGLHDVGLISCHFISVFFIIIIRCPTFSPNGSTEF